MTAGKHSKRERERAQERERETRSEREREKESERRKQKGRETKRERDRERERERERETEKDNNKVCANRGRLETMPGLGLSHAWKLPDGPLYLALLGHPLFIYLLRPLGKSFLA